MIHAFEERGLGIAPFRFIDCVDAGPLKYQKPPEGCDFCGTAIRYLYIIEDANGKRAIVGSECIAKSGDLGLIDIAKRTEKLRRADAREAKRQREYEERRQRQEKRLQAERDRNGGLTDYEVEQTRRDREEAEAIARQTAENQWIIDLLEAQSSISEWKRSMIYQLKRHPVSYFSDRNRHIFADIYARQFGRANSKAYNAAYDEAEARFGNLGACGS